MAAKNSKSVKKEEIIQEVEISQEETPEVESNNEEIIDSTNDVSDVKEDEPTTEPELPSEFDYKDYHIVIEPHKLGVRAILCTSWGTFLTEAFGERESAIEKVKAYAE